MIAGSPQEYPRPDHGWLAPIGRREAARAAATGAATNLTPVEPFVVSINAGAQRHYRTFWTGPLGTAALIVPGLVVAVVGLILGVTQGEGITWFFAAVIIFSGLYASYAGWDHRRKAARGTQHDPLAFAIESDGVVFPRGKRYPWTEARFVLTDEQPPRILCTPIGLAYAIDRLDREPDEIHAALTAASAGVVGLEHA